MALGPGASGTVATARPVLVRATTVATGDVIATSSQRSGGTSAWMDFSNVHASPPSVLNVTVGSAQAAHVALSHAERSSAHALMRRSVKMGIERPDRTAWSRGNGA